MGSTAVILINALPGHHMPVSEAWPQLEFLNALSWRAECYGRFDLLGALCPRKLHLIASTVVSSKSIGRSSSAFLSSCPFLGFRIPCVPSLMQSGSVQLSCFAGEKEESYQLKGQKGTCLCLPMFQVLEQPDHHPHSDLNKGYCGQV